MASKTKISPPYDGLHCQCCSSFYNDPRILSCLHSFCLECLTKMHKKQDDEMIGSVTCPSCKELTFLGDLTSLPFNLRLAFKVEQNKIVDKLLTSPPLACEACEDLPAVAYCTDCNDLLCDDCWKVHKKQKVTKSHSTLDLEELKKKPRGELVQKVGPSVESIAECQHHDKCKLSHYCHTIGCCVPICVECTNDRHDQTKGHEVKEIEENTVDQVTANLKQSAERLKGNWEKLDQVVKRIDETKQKVQTRKGEVDENIHNKLDELHNIIDQRGKKLLEENAEIANSKCQHLSTQRLDIQQLAQCIDSCISMTCSATDEYSNVQLLATANTLLNRANGLQQQYTDAHLDLIGTPDIYVNVETVKIKDLIGGWGSVVDLHTNGAQYFAMLPRQKLGVGATMNVKVGVKNVSGNASHVVIAKLLCEGKVINDCLAITDMNDGSHGLSVTFDREGNHQLSIAVNGQDIQGSPFNLTIVPKRHDYTKLDQPVSTITRINKPRYIAFANNGDMFVTSDGDHRIHVYGVEEKEKMTIGSGKGSGQTQFKSPYGIDIYDDVIYVADCGNDRIQQLTTDGVFTGMYGKRGSAPGQFNCPHDVKINPADGKIYVADTNNSRVQVFNPDWSISHVIDGTVKDDGSFSRPKGITFDLSGNVCVSACGSGSVLVFDTKGDLVQQFHNLYNPTGIAVDPSGYHLISCYTNSELFQFVSADKIVVLDANGRSVHIVRSLKFSGHGIAFSPHDGTLWVADPSTNRLLKF